MPLCSGQRSATLSSTLCLALHASGCARGRRTEPSLSSTERRTPRRGLFASSASSISYVGPASAARGASAPSPPARSSCCARRSPARAQGRGTDAPPYARCTTARRAPLARSRHRTAPSCAGGTPHASSTASTCRAPRSTASRLSAWSVAAPSGCARSACRAPAAPPPRPAAVTGACGSCWAWRRRGRTPCRPS